MRIFDHISESSVLPDSIGNLTQLADLSVVSENFESLPESFGNLSSLCYLTLLFMKNLTCLPESFGRLTALQALNLKGSNELTALPMSFGKLQRLRCLYLTEMKSLAELPPSVCDLPLEYLRLKCCPALRSLPSPLKSLKQLHLLDCCELDDSPEIITLLAPALTHLYILKADQANFQEKRGSNWASHGWTHVPGTFLDEPGVERPGSDFYRGHFFYRRRFTDLQQEDNADPDYNPDEDEDIESDSVEDDMEDEELSFNVFYELD
jgi:hypothetical protein